MISLNAEYNMLSAFWFVDIAMIFILSHIRVIYMSRSVADPGIDLKGGGVKFF